MVIIIIGIDSCYSARPYHVVSQPMPENKTDSAATLAQVYFYPKQNQTPERMDRDRYQCYQGAVKQTGFDPNASSLPPKQRMAVIPAPAPGQEVAASTVIGAAIGAIAAGPRHALGGAAIGAGTGVLVGTASASAKQESARQMEESLNSQEEARYDRDVEGKASAFRRAMSACLEGRGYGVQ
jgi:hypothetical protein